MPATKSKTKKPAVTHQPPSAMSPQERAALEARNGRHATNIQADTSRLESDSLDAASKVHDFESSIVNCQSSIDEEPGPIDSTRPPILGPRPGGYQPSQVQVAMQRADERRNLAGLLEFLEARRERIHVRSSCPGSVALRSVKSNADAIRWILQNLHRVRIVD